MLVSKGKCFQDWTAEASNIDNFTCDLVIFTPTLNKCTQQTVFKIRYSGGRA